LEIDTALELVICILVGAGGSMHGFMLSAVPESTTAEFALVISFVSPRYLR